MNLTEIETLQYAKELPPKVGRQCGLYDGMPSIPVSFFAMPFEIWSPNFGISLTRIRDVTTFQWLCKVGLADTRNVMSKTCLLAWAVLREDTGDLRWLHREVGKNIHLRSEFIAQLKVIESEQSGFVQELYRRNPDRLRSVPTDKGRDVCEKVQDLLPRLGGSACRALTELGFGEDDIFEISQSRHMAGACLPVDKCPACTIPSATWADDLKTLKIYAKQWVKSAKDGLAGLPPTAPFKENTENTPKALKIAQHVTIPGTDDALKARARSAKLHLVDIVHVRLHSFADGTISSRHTDSVAAYKWLFDAGIVNAFDVRCSKLFAWCVIRNDINGLRWLDERTHAEGKGHLEGAMKFMSDISCINEVLPRFKELLYSGNRDKFYWRKREDRLGPHEFWAMNNDFEGSAQCLLRVDEGLRRLLNMKWGLSSENIIRIIEHRHVYGDCLPEDKCSACTARAYGSGADEYVKKDAERWIAELGWLSWKKDAESTDVVSPLAAGPN